MFQKINGEKFEKLFLFLIDVNPLQLINSFLFKEEIKLKKKEYNAAKYNEKQKQKQQGDGTASNAPSDNITSSLINPIHIKEILNFKSLCGK